MFFVFQNMAKRLNHKDVLMKLLRLAQNGSHLTILIGKWVSHLDTLIQCNITSPLQYLL